jgi:uncharacterized protein with HEPN domain
VTWHPQRVPDSLGHILQAIERIQRYTGQMEESEFLQNEIVQDAVVRNLEIIGEACRNIERHHPAFSAAHPQLPIAFAYRLRNVLVHGYFTVDFHIVWTTVRKDLPFLSEQVQSVLRTLELKENER